MMNHAAQESRAGSVLAKLHALRAMREMRRGGELNLSACGEGERFALNTHQRALHMLLHGAIRRTAWALALALAFRSKELYSDARQKQQYESYAFHFLKSGAKVLQIFQICKIFSKKYHLCLYKCILC